LPPVFSPFHRFADPMAKTGSPTRLPA